MLPFDIAYHSGKSDEAFSVVSFFEYQLTYIETAFLKTCQSPFRKNAGNSCCIKFVYLLINSTLGQSENSVAILLSGYSFVSLRHETMASITDSIS